MWSNLLGDHLEEISAYFIEDVVEEIKNRDYSHDSLKKGTQFEVYQFTKKVVEQTKDC